MRYDAFPAELFDKNRRKLKQLLPAKAIVIVGSNDIMPTNADGSMGFKQNSDLFYLTGIDQEDTFLILYPDAPEEHLKEILFVRETSELIAIWEGFKLTKNEVLEISGIRNIQWVQNFDSILKTICYSANEIFLFKNEHIRNSSLVQTQNDRLAIDIKNKYPFHLISR